MRRRIHHTRPSFRSRKKHYKSKHKFTGFDFLKKFAAFFMASKLRSIAILLGIAAVITAVLVVVLAKPVPVTAQNTSPELSTPAQEVNNSEAPVDTKPDDYNASETEEVDEDTLAGLTGEGLEDEPVGDDSEGDISEAELKGAIGVVFDNVNSGQETTILQKIEKASASAIKDGKIGQVKFYNSKGDLNQQLQDMRSMINSNAKVIVIDVADKETYIMMTKMAKNANIPVVAINAPANEGYIVNIVEDTSIYGQKSAQFISQKLTAGNILQVYGKEMGTEEQQRINLIKSALEQNTNIKSLDVITVENKASKIKEAVAKVVEKAETVDAVVTSQEMSKTVLNYLLSQNIIPKVFCGDSTAGFLKLWYKLKTEGVTFEKEKEEDDSDKNNTKTSETPQPETYVVKATGTETYCSESSPYGIGGTAIQFALRLSEGKTLKAGTLQNNTYTYSPKLVITDENLAQYYETFKGEADDYIISDWIPDADIDAMFE